MPTPPLLERGLDSSSGLGFVRERLALLGKTLFLVSFGFYLFLLASLVLIGGAPFVAVVRGPVALGHLCASLTMALLWLLASRARLSLWSLGALDAVSFVVAGGFLSLMTIEDEGQILQVLLALTVTVMVRAILMPSRPGRTLLLSALVFAPTVVVCIARHHPTAFLPGFSPGYQKLHMTLNTVLWSVLGTTLATIVSRVLYGLRRQVAEASELGQYLLEEKIGGGGMGEVWRARHRLLIRPAAIKLIRQRALGAMSGDPELLVRRFEREARATAALTSPHTVQLYDFGVTEDGRLYYVMELLDGLDLDTLVRQHGPLPAERVVHLLRQVCSALQDAHGERPGAPRHQAGERGGQPGRHHLRFRQGARLRAGQARQRARRAARTPSTSAPRTAGAARRATWRRRWCSAPPTPITGSTCTRWAVSPTGCSPARWSSRARTPCR